jgi:hypothetical protein
MTINDTTIFVFYVKLKLIICITLAMFCHTTMKQKDQISFRADPEHLVRLNDLTARSKDLKRSAIIRAALSNFFENKNSRLPNGKLLGSL